MAEQVKEDRPMPIEFMGGPYPDMRCSLDEFHISHGVTFLRTDRVVMRQWWKDETGWRFRTIAMFPLDGWDSMVKAIGSEVPVDAWNGMYVAGTCGGSGTDVRAAKVAAERLLQKLPQLDE